MTCARRTFRPGARRLREDFRSRTLFILGGDKASEEEEVVAIVAS
eukprot:CAMPEP_0196216886 /NCGR_PEP_ID=MMETSP0912-20130531/33230_1 /TAXON_ID=49265 /ORGANISM="Thalassiosira rotula, Strain GSO102" /LENGTH=44 /DNA_ID= /DNA_START= /DNA_END= /DNA_ORIENTATION=